MSEVDLIAEKVVELLAKRIPSTSAVPLSHQLWSTKEIAEYLQRPQGVVRDRVVCVPGFPKAIRLPNAGELGRAHPRWKASEVIAWVESYQDGPKIGRPRKSS